VSNFIVNRANKQNNHLAHDFEISLTKDTVIHEAHGDAYASIDVSFNITKISAISMKDVGKCFS
jgi:hypothetical protein